MDEERPGGRRTSAEPDQDLLGGSAGEHGGRRPGRRRGRRTATSPGEAAGGNVPTAAAEVPRWQVLVASLLVAALWAVALQGLAGVFAPGSWSGRTLVAGAAMVAVSALVRVLRPTARLSACLAGLAAAGAVLAQQVSGGGRAQWWLSDPRAVLVGIRLQLNEGVAPMRVSDPLADLVVLVCLLGVWVSVLLLVGLDLRVPAGLVPALVLLVPVAVTGQRAPAQLLVAAAVGLCALLWVGAPHAWGWRAPVAAGTVLAVGVGVAVLVPTTRDRVWNASAIAVSPVSPNVPDVTVTLGEDLVRPASAVAFRFSGVRPGDPVRFTLAELTEFTGGTWQPGDALDQASASVLDLRPPEFVDIGRELTAEDVESFAEPVVVEITGLVSTWLPLPQGTLLVRPAQDAEGADVWDPGRWQWVEGTQTARSTTALTGRGDRYQAWAWQFLDNQAYRDYFLGNYGYEGEDTSTANDRPELEPYTQLPPDVPDVVADTARDVTGETTGRYEAAAALRDWFRSGSFAYDESAPYAPGADPDDPYATMEAFLDQRRGYCVHFATTFAVMARTLGIPTRVSVGYASRAGSGTSTAVDSRSLHAWPEVFIDGTGWMAFEPTPGGAGTRSETWVVPTDPLAPEEGSGDDGPSPSPGVDQPDREDTGGGTSGEGESEDAEGGGSPAWLPEAGLAVLVVLVLAAAVPGTLRSARRSARRRALLRGEAPAAAAWAEFHDTVLDLGAAGRDRARVLRRTGVGADSGSGADSGDGSGGGRVSGGGDWGGGSRGGDDGASSISGSGSGSGSGRTRPGGSRGGDDGSPTSGVAPRARTPEALVEHLLAVGALEDGADAELLARAVVTERFGGGSTGARSPMAAPVAGPVPTPVEGGATREALRGALEGSVGDLRARAGLWARVRAVVAPRSVLPTRKRVSGPGQPVRGSRRRRFSRRRSSRE